MKYVHMRCIALDDDFYLASNQWIKNEIGYHSVLQRGGATLAIDEENKTIGISVCSTADQFCKRTGRYSAESRAPAPIVVGNQWIVGAPSIGKSDESYICNAAIQEAISYIEKDNPFYYEYIIVRVDKIVLD